VDRETVLGPEHPDTLIGVYCLAALLEELGDFETSDPFELTAVSGCRGVLNLKHLFRLVHELSPILSQLVHSSILYCIFMTQPVHS
jgi:hypothetical protein